VCPFAAVAGDEKITDVRELAGIWRGWVSGQYLSKMTIREDGTYQAAAQGGQMTVGKYYLEDGGKLRSFPTVPTPWASRGAPGERNTNV
jgi:hypothetical protein